jgi:subfamily B ATP-binding cassette protein MsbA
MPPARPPRPSPAAFAWSRARRFARARWRLLVWFAATSLLRIATTVAAILLIQNFLTAVLSTSTGVAARLTRAVGQPAALWVVAGLLVAVFLASALAAYGSQLAMQRLIRYVELDLMEALITHLLRLPVAFFDRRRRGDLIDSVRQDISKARMVAASFIEMLVFGAQAVSYGAAALWLSPRLVLVSLPVLVIGAAPTRWFVAQMRRRSRRMREHGYRLTDLLLQLVQGVRIVKVYAGEELETRNSLSTARRYFSQVVGAARTKALGDVMLETAASLSVVVVIVVGGFEVLAGRLSMPSLVAALVAIRAAHGPVSNCFGRLVDAQANWASLERIQTLLETRPEIEDRPDARPLRGPVESIRFDHVSFGYNAVSPVLDDVSFEVRAGQHIGIVGPSGAGKTTLVSLVARFYDPVEGRILLNGRDLRDYRLADLHRQLALVTQDLFVFGTSVRENIRYGSIAASDDDVERAAMAAEIHDDIMRLPDRYDTILGVGGRLLSAGQVQRINVARALLKNAPIVILDEATSNLDSISEVRIQAALDRLMEGRTTFTIAHRLSTLRNADVILVMDHGTIAGVGPHETLLHGSALYRELWNAQQVASRSPFAVTS